MKLPGRWRVLQQQKYPDFFTIFPPFSGSLVPPGHAILFFRFFPVQPGPFFAFDLLAAISSLCGDVFFI
jgi:hypothetical protein